MTTAPLVLQPGIHLNVPAEVYHADPTPEPSLSNSIAQLLVDRSPRHAWAAHPRLNTPEPKEPSQEMEEGTLLHALLLGTPQVVVEVDADDWKKKASQETRMEVRSKGGIPILSWRMAEMERCVSAFKEQLADHECAPILQRGSAEATLVWRESKTWCRSRVDWLADNPRAPLVDLKTTAGSADPETWERKLRDEYAFQAAFYCRGARACGLNPSGMIFLVLETKPPHGLCVFAPSPDLIGVAEEKVDTAFELWEACRESNVWPGYPRRICYVEAPNWLLSKSEERLQSRPERMAAVKPSPEQIERANALNIKLGQLWRDKE